jgi:membrane-bound ClpP family serine protease
MQIVRAIVPLVFGLAVAWFVLVGVFALSLFVILPLMLVLGVIGALYVWYHKRQMQTASEGEIGIAVEPLLPGQTGLVRFERMAGAGSSVLAFTTAIACESLTPIEAGATVSVVRVEGKTILVQKLEG